MVNFGCTRSSGIVHVNSIQVASSIQVIKQIVSDQRSSIDLCSIVDVQSVCIVRACRWSNRVYPIAQNLCIITIIEINAIEGTQYRPICSMELVRFEQDIPGIATVHPIIVEITNDVIHKCDIRDPSAEIVQIDRVIASSDDFIVRKHCIA